MATQPVLTCPICQGTKFEEGEVSTTHVEAVRFRVRTSMITSDWTDIYAQKCLKCGYVLMFAK